MAEIDASTGFIGRSSELDLLGGALADARTGRARSIIIGGEAGIGKSRLIERFTGGLGSDVRVVAGSCVELGRGELPFAPFVEAFRELLRSIPEGQRPAVLGPGRADLERFVPASGVRKAADPDVRDASPDPDLLARIRLFEVVLGVLERLAHDAPVVLVVEDIHWADASSLDLIGFLGRALRRDRVLTILTVRTDVLDAKRSVLAALAEWERLDHVERHELAPFDAAEIAAQIAARGIQPARVLVEDLAARTDGNPFFIDQLIGSRRRRDPGGHASDLPLALRDVLAARVDLLAEEDQQVVRAAAAAARRIDDTLLSAVLERPVPTVASALRRIVDAGLLVRDSAHDGYRFRHALLREFVERELFSGERAWLHREVARELQRRVDAGDLEIAAGEIAHHLEAAGDRSGAIVASLHAARQAEHVFAYTEAHRLYERVLDLWSEVPVAETVAEATRTDVAERAAETAMLAGNGPRAVELQRALLADVDAVADPLRAGLLHERLRWFLWESDDRGAAADAVHEALRLIPATPPSAARARVLGHVAALELYAHDYESSRAHASEAVEMARAVGARSEEALALGVRGWDRAVLGDLAGGLTDFEMGQRIAAELGSPEGQALAAVSLASLLDRAGRSTESLAAANVGLATVRRLGVARTYGGLLFGYVVKALVSLGRWDEASAAAAEGIDQAIGDRPVLWLLINRARLLVGRGDAAGAAADLERARGIEERLAGTEFRANLLAAEAEAAIWEGRIEDVRAIVDAVSATADPTTLPDPSEAWIAAMGLRAEADAAAQARARRDTDAQMLARDRAASITALIDAWRMGPATDVALTTPRGQALSILCREEGRRVEQADDPPGWAEVAEAWAVAGRPFHEAYARFREAEAILTRRGERRAAATALQRAGVTARALDAGPLRRAIEALARHARIDLEGPPPEVTTGVTTADDEADPARLNDGYGFTQREHEVLSLVAGGWSNQQIGDALFISRKTASVHVSNILAKLGVHTRVEAAAIAHRIGVGADAPEPPGRA